MPTLTRQELKDLLADRRGSFFVTIVANTEPDMRKTGNPYVGARKISRVNGVLNWHYGNSVNRQRLREGQPLDEQGEVEHFEPVARKWGQRIVRDDGTLTPFVEHKGRTYLELKVQQSLGYEYRLNGAALDPDNLHPFLRPRNEGARQQVENPVILRDYALDSIEQITVDGQTYEVVNN